MGSTEKRKQCLLTEDLHRRLLAATKDVSSTEISDRAGVDRATVAKILASKSDQPFHFASAEKVLEAFEVEFEDGQIVDASIGSVPSAPKSLLVIVLF